MVFGYNTCNVVQVSIFDLLIVFGHCGAANGQTPTFKPDDGMGVLFHIFVQDHVFIEDEDADMTIKRNFTSAGLFTIQSKLIYQQLLIQEFPAGPTHCAMTMIQSLIYKFNELQQEVAGIERGSEDFHAIKELS